MSERELICIGCPMGCPIVVKMEDGSVAEVFGGEVSVISIYGYVCSANVRPHGRRQNCSVRFQCIRKEILFQSTV